MQHGLRARLSTSIECRDEHWDPAKIEKLSHGPSISNRIVEAKSKTAVVVVTMSSKHGSVHADQRCMNGATGTSPNTFRHQLQHTE